LKSETHTHDHQRVSSTTSTKMPQSHTLTKQNSSFDKVNEMIQRTKHTQLIMQV